MTPYRLVNGRVVPNFFHSVKDTAEFVTDGGDTGVVIIYKSASRSMVATGKTVRIERAEPKTQPANMHVFVRDPVKRLKSAYRFFRAAPPINDRAEKGPMTYEDFIDYVLAGTENMHWRPVTETLSVFGRSDIVPHLFENLAEEYPFPGLGHKNVSEPTVCEVNAHYREDEVKSFYSGDYQLREQA